MNQFKKLSKETVEVREKKILEEWEKQDILNATIKNRENNENFVFYDGPAYANGMPGVHHVLAKLLKDTFCKYETMKGKRVLRKVGWDTHGLPTEVNVEKLLGFNGKKDIEAYGIDKFNEECKKNVRLNEGEFVRLTKRMGQFIDTDNAYITFDNKYIETEWWIFKKYFDAGLFYNGFKILPYCTRCGTELASHEVAQGYKEVSVNSVYVPFKVKNDDSYLLIWTTTPWTLLANVAACVHPSETYVKVESKGYKFILAEKLAHKVLGDDFTVIEKYTGKDLEYLEFEQFLPFVEVDKKAFYVTCDEYVTMEDGTGIVHIAPAYGQDDYNVSLKYDLPIINPVGLDGCYTEGPWKGRSVIDHDLELEIVDYLKKNDKLFKKEKMKHNYPHCWRCKTPLIYYSKPSWYIKTTAYKDKIIEANKKVKWYPDYVGEKRFANWLDNMLDWGISRNRYWGCPIPLWICEECDHKEMIGSIAELKEKATTEVPDDIDLHRPHVDHIHLTCPECGHQMTRITDVADVWFDSGAMPFAQYHYPFENKELFEEQFPADFIAEGIDQTRGWFYVLLVISTFIKGESPFKNVLVNDLLLDKNGGKMHKSRGNAVEPFTIMDKYGADALRWYMPYVSPVWTPIKFDEEGLKEVNSKFINTLRNTYSFFELYANTDEIDPRTFEVDYSVRPLIDKWLLSKYHRLVRDVTSYYDEYDLTKVVRSITNFVNEDLSNWYIRRNRRRFWGNELNDDKKAVYKTTYEVLLGLTKLIAPVVPFVSEEIYKNLTGNESVHLEDFPVYDETYIDDEIEKRMDLVRDLISLGRNAREEAKIKVRQPISKVLLDGKVKDVIGDLTSLIEEELNVKEVVYKNNLSDFMNFTVLPNYKVAGPIFGPDIKLYAEALKHLSVEEIVTLQNGENIDVLVQDVPYNISSDMVVIRIQAKEGFNAQMENNNFIILDTELNQSLINEGIARELISKVQNLRKQKDFEVADRIYIYYDGDQEFEEALKEFEDFVKNETLAVELQKKDNLKESFDLNGHDVKLDVEKVTDK